MYKGILRFYWKTEIYLPICKTGRQIFRKRRKEVTLLTWKCTWLKKEKKYEWDILFFCTWKKWTVTHVLPFLSSVRFTELKIEPYKYVWYERFWYMISQKQTRQYIIYNIMI